VLATIGPVKLIVPPMSLVTNTPLPSSVIGPLSVSVPPDRLVIATELPDTPPEALTLICAATEAVPLPPLTSRPSPPVFAIVTLEPTVKVFAPVALIRRRRCWSRSRSGRR